MCRSHELQQLEGVLFQSHQPSHLLLMYAPFGLPDFEWEPETDDTRRNDRSRQAAEREAFLMEESN